MASAGVALDLAMAAAELLSAVGQEHHDSDLGTAYRALRSGSDPARSPSLRQSKELFGKVARFLKSLEPVEAQPVEL
jgi:hypothetical protein